MNLKKLASLIVAIAMFASLIAIPANATTDATIGIEIQDQDFEAFESPAIGDIIVADIYMENVTKTLYTFQYVVGFDSAVLEPIAYWYDPEDPETWVSQEDMTGDCFTDDYVGNLSRTIMNNGKAGGQKKTTFSMTSWNYYPSTSLVSIGYSPTTPADPPYSNYTNLAKKQTISKMYFKVIGSGDAKLRIAKESDGPGKYLEACEQGYLLCCNSSLEIMTAALVQPNLIIGGSQTTKTSITVTQTTGGTITPDGAVTDLDVGSEKKFTVEADTGYDVASVTYDGTTVPKGGDGKYTVTVVDGAKVFTATYTKKVYAVTINSNEGTVAGGSVVSRNGATVQHDGTVIIDLTLNQGFSFTADKTFSGGPSAFTYTIENVTGPVSVDVNFAALTEGAQAVLFHAANGDVINNSTGTAVTARSYYFKFNYPVSQADVDSLVRAPGLDDAGNAPTVLVDGTDATKVNVVYGSDLIFNTRYNFSVAAGMGTSELQSNPVLAGAFATYFETAKQQFTVTSGVKSGQSAFGSVTPASRVVDSGATTTFTITPATGYTVDQVTGVAGSVSGSLPTFTYTTGNIEANGSIEVSFKKIQLSVAPPAAVPTVAVSAISADKTTVDYDGSVTVSFTANENYTPASIYVNGNKLADLATNATSYVIENVIAAITSITVNFDYNAPQPNMYTVRAFSNNEAWGTVTPGTQEIEEGQTATITAIPADGYMVVSADNGAVCNGTTITLANVTAATDVTVTFAKTPDEFNITNIDLRYTDYEFVKGQKTGVEAELPYNVTQFAVLVSSTATSTDISVEDAVSGTTIPKIAGTTASYALARGQSATVTIESGVDLYTITVKRAYNDSTELKEEGPFIGITNVKTAQNPSGAYTYDLVINEDSTYYIMGTMAKDSHARLTYDIDGTGYVAGARTFYVKTATPSIVTITVESDEHVATSGASGASRTITARISKAISANTSVNYFRAQYATNDEAVNPLSTETQEFEIIPTYSCFPFSMSLASKAATATVKIGNAAPINYLGAFSIAISKGETKQIQVVVTAENNDTETYNIEVSRDYVRCAEMATDKAGFLTGIDNATFVDYENGIIYITGNTIQVNPKATSTTTTAWYKFGTATGYTWGGRTVALKGTNASIQYYVNLVDDAGTCHNPIIPTTGFTVTNGPRP